MTTAYEAARAEVNEATKVYQAALAAYRAYEISDHSLAVSQAAYKVAQAKFDVAFAIAQNEPEVESAVIVANDQIALF